MCEINCQLFWELALMEPCTRQCPQFYSFIIFHSIFLFLSSRILTTEARLRKWPRKRQTMKKENLFRFKVRRVV